MIPEHHRARLTEVARSVVEQVCQQRLGAMRTLPRQEIHFVASLVENGAVLLEAGWQPILASSGILVGVAGVFCHQSPMVDIKGRPPRSVPGLRCELADLLILHSHSRWDGKVYWRGFLMQTKFNTGRRMIPDEPQLWLYQSWPNFVITAPGFKKGERDFNEDLRSGRYGLISNTGWLVLPPRSPLDDHSTESQDLGEFLVDMLYDMDPAQPGRVSAHGRQVYRTSKWDWSPTIRELVEITAVRPLRLKGSKHGIYDYDLLRGGGTVLQMMREVAFQRSAIPPHKIATPAEEDGSNGISILLIETHSRG